MSILEGAKIGPLFVTKTCRTLNFRLSQRPQPKNNTYAPTVSDLERSVTLTGLSWDYRLSIEHQVEHSGPKSHYARF